jgi:hypothetical protein
MSDSADPGSSKEVRLDELVSSGLAGQDAETLARKLRQILKREVSRGHIPVYDVIVTPPWFTENAELFDFLFASPQYEGVELEQMLRRCGIPRHARCGDLTPREREELASWFTAGGPMWWSRIGQTSRSTEM